MKDENPIQNQKPFTKRTGTNRRARAMTLVELLIWLTITSMLLAAVAVAVHSSLTNFQLNRNMTAVSVSARNTLRQMCATLRSAWNDPASHAIDVSTDGTQCTLMDAAGRNVIYRYEADSHRLTVNLDGAEAWHVLLENVHPVEAGDAVFSATAPDNPDWPAGTVGRVEIRFMIKNGDIQRTVSAAAVPRNILYGDT